MTQRILKLKKASDPQIVSGTEIMTAGEGGDHTRLLWASVPPFASRPDITISIYSDDDMPPAIPAEQFNSGTTFIAWAIQYVPEGAAGGNDLIAISATNTEPGEATPVRVMCSYVAIGERR